MKCITRSLLIALIVVSLLAICTPQIANTLREGTQQRLVAFTEQRAATAQVKQAWQKAQREGHYNYHTTIIQTIWPLSKLENVGLSASEERLYIEGETNIPDETMQMKLWSQDGNVNDSSLEIKFEGNQAYGRTGQTEWEELDTKTGADAFSNLFAPGKDALTYLQGATNIQNQGLEQRAGVEFTRYTFDIDGPKFAAYMRDQLQDDLVQQGKLPPGVNLDVIGQYVDMQGHGELWLDQNDLPLRQIVHLKFPPAYAEQVEAQITTDFSAWGKRVENISSSLPNVSSIDLTGFMALTRVDWQTTSFTFGCFTIFFLLLYMLITNRSRIVYASVTLTVIATMLLTPLLQSQQAQAFYNEQQQQQATYTAQREAQQRTSEVQAELRGKDFDPHANSLEKPISVPADLPATSPMDKSPLLNTVTRAYPNRATNRTSTVSSGSGTDTDGDGLTDADELQTCSSPYQADTDGDGLDDGLEVLELGTNPCQADSDGDLISDYVEVQGFKDGSGRQWYLNPLDLDSNGDERMDSLDCPDLINIGADGQANPVSFNPPQRCADTDEDGTPNSFDFDDDNDGVPDAVDLAPTTAMGGGVEAGCDGLSNACVEPFPNQTFAFKANNLAIDVPSFVDFQIRPQAPEHLWYTLNVLDWPANDRQGQQQRVFTDTFGASGKDANGDMRLVPMLEIKIPNQGNHYNNLPVKATMQQTPKPAVPAVAGQNIYSDTAILNAWLYSWLDRDIMDRHGISVRVENTNGDLVLNVPLNLVRDKVGDSPVALAGRMVYRPTDADFGQSQQVRLVWAVYGLQDFCKPISNTFRTDLSQAQRYDLWCQDTANWGTTRGILHSYYDDWYLTGLTVREDHGLKVGVIYENPAYQYPAPQPGYESNLWHVANGLQNTFVAGRTTSQADVTMRDITVDDIEHRFDITSTATITERWQLPAQALQVNVYPEPGRFADGLYPDQSYISEIPMTHTKTILQQYTSQAVTNTTLLFVREEYYRFADLEGISIGNKTKGIATQSSLSFNLDPAQFQQQVLAGINWAPYRDKGAGVWESYAIDEYWDKLAVTFNATFAEEYPDDSRAINQGRVVFAQAFYLSLFSGASNIIQNGDNLLILLPFISDSDLASNYSIAGSAGKLVNALVEFGAKNIYAAGRSLTTSALLSEIGNGIIQKVTTITDKLGLWGSIGAGIAMAAVLAAIVVTVMLTDVTAREAVMTTLQVVSFVASVRTIYTAYNALGTTVTAAARSAAQIAAVIGLIVVVAVTAGLFMYQMIAGGVRFGSVEFNQALAGAVATVIVAAIMFAIGAIFPVGTLIVAIIAAIDLLIMVICKVTDTEASRSASDWEFWACSGINGMLTALVQYLIYSNNPLVDLQADGRLDIGNFNQHLLTPALGTSVGNRVAVSMDVVSVLHRNSPNSWMGAVYWWHYTEDRYIKQSDFDYQLVPDKRTIDGPLSTAGMHAYWQSSDTGIVEKHQPVSYNNLILEHAGINQRSTLYLAEGYAINTQECFVLPPPLSPYPVCYLRDKADTLHIDVGDRLIFDIFPATLDEFYTLTALGDGSYRLAWDSRFPALRDADGDGLRSRAFGGNDPDDSSADADADGLSDFYEVQHSTDPTNADTDGDGLSDYQELIYNTNPHQADTDNDGLQDGEEVFHQTGLGLWQGGWEYTYSYDAGNQPLKTLMNADPLHPNADGDDYLDKQEQVYGFNPNVTSSGKVLRIAAQVDDADGIIAPGATLNYSVTLENELRNRYALGLLDVDFPVAVQDESLSPQPFTLAEREQTTMAGSVTVKADLAASQHLSLTNSAGARIINLRGDTNAQRSLWLHLNESVGATTFNDSSLLGRHGACSGATCPTAGQPGYTGLALEFDGVDDTIQVSQDIGLNNTSFTLAAWVKRASSGRSDFILSQGPATPSRGLHFGFRGDQFTCAFWADDLDSRQTYTDNNWHHWACTYNATTQQRALYRDGIVVITDTTSAPYYGNGVLYIGSAFGGNYFLGAIDEVEVYPRALSDVEIAERFKEPIFHVDFSVDGSGNVHDHSVYANTVTCASGRCPTLDGDKAVFDKASHYDVSPSANLDLSQGNGHFSIATWIHPESDDLAYYGTPEAWQAVIGNVQDAPNAYPTLWINAEGKVRAGFGDGTQLCAFESQAPVLNMRQWNHVIVTFGPSVSTQATVSEAVTKTEMQVMDENALSSGQLFKLYINGRQITALDGASACAGQSPPTNTQSFSMGRASTNATVYIRAFVTMNDDGDNGESSEHRISLDGINLGERHGVSEWEEHIYDVYAPITGDQQHILQQCELDHSGGCEDLLLYLPFTNAYVGAHRNYWWGDGGRLEWSVSNEFYQGQIDDVRIYRYALDEEEAGDLYMGTALGGGRLELRFDEPPGSTLFRDDSGNGLSATCSSNTCPATGIPGRSNQSVRFDGVDDVVQVPYSPELNPDSFSISAWVKVTGNSGAYRSVLTSHDYDPAPAGGYRLYATSNNTWEFMLSDSGTWTIVGGAPVTMNAWTYLVARYDAASKTMSLYVNGNLAGSQTDVAFAPNPQQALSIGAWATAVDAATGVAERQFYFKGLIDQVNIHSRVLPEAEIGDIAAAQLAWLPLDEGAGATQFSDATGNGYTAVCGGSSCPAAGSAGQIGTATRFDGGDDYVTLQQTPALNNTSFTLAAWVKRERSGVYEAVMGQGTPSQNHGLYFGFRDNNIFTCIFWDNDLDSPQTYTDTDWHHWACTYDIATGRRVLYRDGVPIREDTSAPYLGSSVFHIAAFPGGYHFQGTLDEVQIYNRALSAGEIASIRGSLWLRLDEGAGATTFVDALGSTHTGTCLNCPTTDVPGQMGTAAYFDGVDDTITVTQAPLLDKTSFTLAAWAKHEPDGNSDMILSQGQAVNNVGLHFGFRDNNTFTCAFFANDLDSAQAYSDSDWHHWACTYDAATGQRTLFRDGMVIAEDTALAPYQGKGTLWVGSGLFGTDSFKGALDEVEVYPYVLSPIEITNRLIEPALYAKVPVVNLHLDERFGALSFANEADPTSNGSCINCPQAGVKGQMYQAVSFSGVQEVAVPATPSLDLDRFSISLWVQPKMRGHWQTLLAKDATSARNYGLWLVPNTTQVEASLGLCDSGTTLHHRSIGALIQDKWNHVMLTYDGEILSLYLNGSLDSALPFVGTLCKNDDALRLGYLFSGQLDEVLLYAQALRKRDVETLYTYQAGWFDTSVAHDIIVDADYPIATVDFSASHIPMGAGQVIAIRAIDATSDIVSVEYQFNGQGWQATTPDEEVWLCTITPPNEGTHTLEVRATDTVGHESVPHSVTFVADGTGPDAALDEALTQQTLPAHPDSADRFSVTLNGSVSDSSSGVNTVFVDVLTPDGVSLNGQQLAILDLGNERWQIDYVFSSPPNGQFTVQLYAQDMVGNDGQSSASIQIDSAAPQADLTFATGFTSTLAGVDANLPMLYGTVSDLPYPSNPCLQLHFEEKSGATAFYDTSGNQSMGECTAPACPTAGLAGQYGVALGFDGVDDVMQIPLVTEAANSISLVAWVKWAGSTVMGTPQFIINNGNDNNNGYGIVVEDDGTLKIINGGVGEAASTTTLTAGVWQHVAAVRNNGVWQIYLDGSMLSVSGNPTPVAPDGKTTIGGNFAGGENFNGLIDEVRLYERALTAEQIRAMGQPSAVGVQDLDISFQHARDTLTTLDLSFEESEPPYPTAPQLRLHFEEASGATTFYDSSSNQYNGVCTAPGCPTAGVPGQYGAAIGFDGSDDYVQVPLVTQATDNVSLAAWVKWAQASGAAQIIVYNGDTGSSGYGLIMMNGVLHILNGGVAFASSTTTLPAGTWQHIAAVRDNGTWKLYLNGQALPLSYQFATPAVPTGQTIIGANHAGGQNFNGSIDEVLIYDYALTTEQIRAISTRTTEFADASDNGLAATCSTGTGACPTAGVAGQHGAALDFDGMNDYLSLSGAEQLGLKDSSFTVAAWVKGDAFGLGTNYTILGTDALATNVGLHLMVRNGKPYMGFYANDTVGNTTLVSGQWYHLVWRYDKATGEQAIFVNGVLDVTNTGHAPFQGDGPVNIGRCFSSNYFDGVLDEVRIYRYALSADEVFALTNASQSDETIWYPVSLDQPDTSFSTWSYLLPAVLEGPYQINLRSVDHFSHTHIMPNMWMGEIDTLAPRLTLAYQDLGDNGALVQCTAQDYNLTEDGFNCADSAVQLQRENQAASWYTMLFSQTKLAQLSTPSQILQGASNTLTACDLAGNCATMTAVQNRAALLALAAMDTSRILTPTTHSVFTNTNPITITGYVMAKNFLQELNLTVDDSPVYTETWTPDTVTETTWTTSWAPPGEGAYNIQTTLTDGIGSVITNTTTSTVYVDLNPPVISLNTSQITGQNFDEYGYISLSGLVTEAVGLQRLQVQVETAYTNVLPVGLWQDVALPSGPLWQGAVYGGSPSLPDGETITLSVRAIDLAGQNAIVSRTFLADAAPPAPVAVTLAYTNQLGTLSTITPGMTIRDADALSPTLLITWTEAADNSGIARYVVGWTVTHTLAAEHIGTLTSYIPTQRSHSQNVDEAQKLYAHVMTEDTYGNQNIQTLGPVYVDGGRTPDYIALGDASSTRDVYHGWMESGCSLIGVDSRMSRRASALASLNMPQKLYVTWNDSDLRLTWTGANWDTDGDLFIYLSTPMTDSAASVLAYDAYSSTQPITLPQAANVLLWVQDSQVASWMRWDNIALAWVEDMSRTLTYHFDANLDTPHTDLSIPFATLGITNPTATNLGLLAFATEEGTMLRWATAPVRNTVNSERASSRLQAALRTDNAYDNLTRAYPLHLGDQVCPSEGVFSEADVRAQLSANPVGYNITSYEDNWFGAVSGDIRRFSIGDGEDIVYQLTYVNQGTDTATNVTVVITAGELRLHNAPVPVGDFVWRDTLALGDIAPGASAQALFTGTVVFNVANTETISGFVWVEAQLSYDASDYVGEPIDAYKVFHRIDTAPPSYLEILQPRTLIGPGLNRIRGLVHDESFVPTLTLQIQIPTAPIDTLICTDTTPQDEFWACNWDAGTSGNNDDIYNLRYQAVDRLGHVSAWTAWLPLTLDTQPVSVSLDAHSEAALGDGWLLSDEATLSGQLHDNRLVGGIEACSGDGQTCEAGQITLDPSTLPQNTFTYDDVPSTPIPVGSVNSCQGGTLITRTFIVSDNFIVADVNLGFNANLFYRNTIVPTLHSPSGTSITLHYPLGYTARNLDVMWDDAAMAVVFDEENAHTTAAPYYENTRRPDEALQAFNGEPSQGTWQLIICDHFSLTTSNGTYNRSRLVLSADTLPTNTQANWRYTVPLEPDYDGVTQTLHIYGLDSVGNRNREPLSLTFLVDTVPPIITVTTWPVLPFAVGDPLYLEGLVSDGVGLQVVRLVGYTPNRETLGDTLQIETDATGTTWAYTNNDLFTRGGFYKLWIEAVDFAGNQGTAGPFELALFEPGLAPTRVDIISGPAQGKTNTPYAFTARVSPDATAQPITYTWEASGQMSQTVVSYLQSTITYTWTISGEKTITVTADNAYGIVSQQYNITIVQADERVYLPVVMRGK